jgi:hypothetical protein
MWWLLLLSGHYHQWFHQVFQDWAEIGLSLVPQADWGPVQTMAL